MNTKKTLHKAIDGAKQFYDKASSYTDQAADRAYEALRGGAGEVGPWVDDVADRLSSAAQDGRKRLEAVGSDIEDQLNQLRKDGKKVSRRTRKKLEKARKKAEKQAKKAARKENGGNGWVTALLISAVTLIVGGIVFSILREKNTYTGLVDDAEDAAKDAAEDVKEAVKDGAEKAEEVLKGDETFSDIEPKVVKVEHAETGDNAEAKEDEQK